MPFLLCLPYLFMLSPLLSGHYLFIANVIITLLTDVVFVAATAVIHTIFMVLMHQMHVCHERYCYQCMMCDIVTVVMILLASDISLLPIVSQILALLPLVLL